MNPVVFSAGILAGGASKRFGSNKALALFDGEPLVARAARVLALVSGDLFLVSNDPAPYSFLNLRVYPDEFPGHGPLSGLHAALIAARHDWVLLAACDMPFLSPALVRALATAPEEGDAAVVPASARGLEPLHALYSRSCLRTVEEALRQGEFGMQRLLTRVKARILPYGQVQAIAGEVDPFQNVNTLEELADRCQGRGAG